MLTVADLIADGLRLPLPEEPAVDLPAETVCAVTGAALTRGYPRAAMTTDATAEFLDHFRGDLHGYVSVNAARCYKSANPRTGNPCARALACYADYAALPLIARDSPADRAGEHYWQTLPRPCWSDLARQLWQTHRGKTGVLLVTTDTKKRLWPRAQAGALGPRTPVYLYDSATGWNRSVFIHWERFLWVLDVVEEAYGAGYVKPQLRESLYRNRKLPLADTVRRERDLSPLRAHPEFALAVLIAQKPLEAAAP